MPLARCAKILFLGLLVLAVAPARAAPTPSTVPAASPERRPFGVLYTAWVHAGDPWVTVRMRITRHPEWVHWMRLSIDPARYKGFKGNGTLEVKGSEVSWRPPAESAWLQYKVNLQSKRSTGRFDGMVTKDWALFRADDLVPPIHPGLEDLTRSDAKLRINVPDGWSIETPFPRYRSGRLRIDNPQRMFDRPTGWIALGKLGTRRERIGNTRIAVAAPTGIGVHRLDTLAFLRFTVPVMQKIFPQFPERVLLVSAGDPMWRGALSGPASMFVHAERPLISENATSTFLHELVHVAMHARSAPNADWIVEGLAEYYSLEALHRGGAISDRRYEAAHAALAKWGEQAPLLEAASSSGAVTARAVGVLRTVDRDIRAKSGGAHSLDDVVRVLASEAAPITRARFDQLVAQFSRP